MKKQISYFSAKCGDCKRPFKRPALGSFSYGEYVFNTVDGKNHVLASAFDPFPEKLKDLIPKNKPELFWRLLAMLADPLNEANFTSTIVCPNCRSTNIEIVKGEYIEESEINEVSFLNASKLSGSELLSLVSTLVKNA